MSFFGRIGAAVRDITNVFNKIDTNEAGEKIRANIHFRGPNVWILAFSIIIACTGLNINSTAVIIGAMLISPLLGPIFGFGMGLGVNDTKLIRASLMNLLVMVLVSLFVATLFFVVSPLTLVNPTELEARTNPSIYDVLVALFGGMAGVFEMSRKEKGTVLSGVAIATAIMPPLCTAGYGLAHLKLNFFLGAMYLFFINFVFITLATYVMVKYLRFPTADIPDPKKARLTRRIIALVMIIFTIPSVWTAANMIQSNNFILKARTFVSESKNWDRSYIYDYEIDGHKGGSIDIYFGGEPLKSFERENLITRAQTYGITEDQITIHEQVFENDEGNASDSEILMKGIYERTDLEINRREAQIKILEDQLREYRNSEIPYTQITQEVRSQYPDIENLFLTRGASVSPAEAGADTLGPSAGGMDENRCILVVAQSSRPIPATDLERLENWLKIRLNDTTVVVFNRY